MADAVTVLITRTPFNTSRNSEALRMSVGLTLNDENSVQVLFLGDGVYMLTPLRPEVIGSLETEKHLEMLKLLNCRLVADEESVEDRLAGMDIRESVELMKEAELYSLMNKSKTVIRY